MSLIASRIPWAGDPSPLPSRRAFWMQNAVKRVPNNRVLHPERSARNLREWPDVDAQVIADEPAEVAGVAGVAGEDDRRAGVECAGRDEGVHRLAGIESVSGQVSSAGRDHTIGVDHG
jgi:hypothetical protein